MKERIDWDDRSTQRARRELIAAGEFGGTPLNGF